MSTTVSLDNYRTEGVRVFLGRERGRKVAEAIKEEHDPNVQVVIPDDVYLVDRNFRQGFHRILPDVHIPDPLNEDTP